MSYVWSANQETIRNSDLTDARNWILLPKAPFRGQYRPFVAFSTLVCASRAVPCFATSDMMLETPNQHPHLIIMRESIERYILLTWLVVSTPSEKYESQLGLYCSQYMEKYNIAVPNHQPVTYGLGCPRSCRSNPSYLSDELSTRVSPLGGSSSGGVGGAKTCSSNLEIQKSCRFHQTET